MSKYTTIVGERLARIGEVFAALERANKRLDEAKKGLPPNSAISEIIDHLSDRADMHDVDAFLAIVDRCISQVSVKARELDHAAKLIEEEKAKAKP